MTSDGRPPAPQDSRGPGPLPPGRGAARVAPLARRVLVLSGVLLVLPLAVAFASILTLLGQPFGGVGEIDPADVRWLSVRLLNRAEVDGGGDVGPFYADPADVPALLDSLRGAAPVPAWAGARGPWFGEFRVMTAEGRRGTVRLYWHRPPQAPLDRPPVLRVQVGPNLYEGGDVRGVIAAAEAAQGRGRARP